MQIGLLSEATAPSKQAGEVEDLGNTKKIPSWKETVWMREVDEVSDWFTHSKNTFVHPVMLKKTK